MSYYSTKSIGKGGTYFSFVYLGNYLIVAIRIFVPVHYK